MSDEKNSNLSTLILGVAIGAALTYLFTTKRGQKIKDRLLTEGQGLLEDIGEKISNLEEEILEEKDEIEEKLEEGTKAVAEKVVEAADEIPQHIEQIQKKGRRFFFRRGGPES
ncbi:MAG: YtxH domain-containing protein [Candidatus Curtissbacteria bacterium]|nr:YtxH domain-containing protein [Candidatus Curtissbacteria bacterium]